MDSMSEYAMNHIKRGGGGFTSGEEDEDGMSDGNAIHSASESGAEKYGDDLHKIKRRRKKITLVGNTGNNDNSAVPSLYEIAKRHRREDYDDDVDDVVERLNKQREDLTHLDEQEYRELFRIPYESAFTKVVTNESDRALMEPYLNMTSSEKQRQLESEMLRSEMRKKPKPIDLRKLTPSARFARIEDHLRVGLRRSQNLYFISQLDALLAEHFQDSTELPIVLSFTENFYRFICHGVCQYYCLTSYSVDYRGERVTIILVPNGEKVTLPSQPLHKYLQELSGGQVKIDMDTKNDFWKKYDSATFMNDFKHAQANPSKNSTSFSNGTAKKKKYRKSKQSFGVKQY